MRRCRSNLRILGSGVIVYTLWELLKPLLIGLLIPETDIATAAEYTALPYSAGEAVAVLFSLIVVFLLDVILRFRIGRAARAEAAGRRAGSAYVVLAFLLFGLLLPVLWHTAYDASTGFNLALSSEDEKVQFLGVIVWLTVIGVSTVLQFVVLIRFKKKTGKYCAMELQGSPDAA